LQKIELGFFLIEQVRGSQRKKDEKMNTENTLNAVDIVRKLVQRNADESINEQATLEVIQKAFEEIKSQDISNEQVLEALNRIYDNWTAGGTLNMPVLVGGVVRELPGVNFMNEKFYTTRVQHAIRAQIGPRGQAPFGQKTDKGRGCGIWRWSERKEG
jgi:hypothetical protein